MSSQRLTLLCHICGMSFALPFQIDFPRPKSAPEVLCGHAAGSADTGMMYSSAVVQARIIGKGSMILFNG